MSIWENHKTTITFCVTIGVSLVFLVNKSYISIDQKTRNEIATQESQARQQSRSEALRVVAQQKSSDTCWQFTDRPKGNPLKIGEVITFPGMEQGKIPTECVVYFSKGKPSFTQYAYAQYLNGVPQIIWVFSEKEVNNTKGKL